MKHTKRILSVLLALVLLLCSVPAAFAADVVDSGTCGDVWNDETQTYTYLTWSLDSEGTLTISGEGQMYDYYYTYDNGVSRTDAPWGKYYKTIQSVVLGDSVTNIGNYAFYRCTALESVTIGDSVTSIGDRAFYNCTALESVTIGKSVTSIGIEAFYYCTALESVTIGNSVTSIGNYAFYRCTALESVTIGDSVTSIGERAFYGCAALESVTIPDSVTSIGYDAFSNCTALESVTLPDGITSIGSSAFSSDYSWYTLALCNKNSTTAATLAAMDFLYAFLDGTDEDNLIHEQVNASLSFTIDKRTRTMTVQTLSLIQRHHGVLCVVRCTVAGISKIHHRCGDPARLHLGERQRVSKLL